MALAPGGRFVVEEGEDGAAVADTQPSMLQESERDILYFQEFFVGQPHDNYLAVESPVGPVSVSLIALGDEYKAIYRTDKGSKRLACLASSVPVSLWRRILRMGPATAAVLNTLSPAIPVQSIRLCPDPSIPTAMLAAEERQVIRSYKIGVLYAKAGQRTEAELFGNRHEDTSAEYRTFLGLIGQTIVLKGWKGYRGGLNVTDDLTGTHSVYTRWQGYEVMFHVATLLPYVSTGTVQLERKRHVGNDIVTIIFQEDDTPIDLDTFDSKQTHVVVAVQPLPNQQYRLTVARKTTVPAFLPVLPASRTISHDVPSRDFLLAKLISGERAAYQAPDFAQKISRTRSVLLKDIAAKHV